MYSFSITINTSKYSDNIGVVCDDSFKILWIWINFSKFVIVYMFWLHRYYPTLVVFSL